MIHMHSCTKTVSYTIRFRNHRVRYGDIGPVYRGEVHTVYRIAASTYWIWRMEGSWWSWYHTMQLYLYGILYGITLCHLGPPYAVSDTSIWRYGEWTTTEFTSWDRSNHIGYVLDTLRAPPPCNSCIRKLRPATGAGVCRPGQQRAVNFSWTFNNPHVRCYNMLCSVLRRNISTLSEQTTWRQGWLRKFLYSGLRHLQCRAQTCQI